MRLAICIITFRRPAGLGRLLEGLRAIEQPEGADLSIVVVDNDPERGAASVVEAARTRLTCPILYLPEPR